MTPSPPDSSGSMMAALSLGDRKSDLTHRVKDLPTHQFISLLDQITGEFEHFLRAIDLINDDALETMLEQILEAFTLKIGQILNADRTTIFLVDEEREELWSKIAQGEGEDLLEIRVPINAGIAGHVATTGEYLNIADAYSHPLFNRDVDRQTGYRTRNILCMPIRSTDQQQVVAVVQLLNKRTGTPFDTADERSFRQFADAIGIIIESCRSFYVAARNQRGVHALLRAAACLAQSLDLDKTLQSVMDEARKLIQADRSTLFLLDGDRKELWSRVADVNGKEMIDIRIPANRGIAGYVASTGKTLNILNAYEDPRFDRTTDQRTGYLTRNILCMPVFNSSGDLIGVTQLINKKKGCFTSSDEEFMQAFNVQAGIALENAQLFESVLQEKQYQKDILESLSDAVISTDMDGNIVTINDAALELLGCPVLQDGVRHQQLLWRQRLIGRKVWEVIPIDNLQMRLEDSLTQAARHYVPEQALSLGIVVSAGLEGSELGIGGSDETNGNGEMSGNGETNDKSSYCPTPPGVLPFTGAMQVPPAQSVETHILAIRDRTMPDYFVPWNDTSISDVSTFAGFSAIAVPYRVPGHQVRPVERSVNLTVNPLTDPEGSVRGGLVVLEDISQEKRMKATMYRYMTPGVAERVMALGEDALMVGERKEVSILFSDIRGYTFLTERLEAAEVVSLLNSYFETMVEAVFNCEGTLDKFIGDALMAVFGAPLPLDDHAWRSVQSALEMRRRLAEFNYAQPDDLKIKIGVGISSGEVVSGNIGSQKRMDYTVIGNGVNVSSRLEGLTKQYGTTDPAGCDIIISEFTYQLCRDRVWVRELDRIRVKGKSTPISIYELLGDRQEPLDSTTEEFIDAYAAGRSAYNQRDFAQAIQHFQIAQRLKPNDRAAVTHLVRSQAYLQNPPTPQWDGVHTMTAK
ncbi:MAG: GAF domain-containing protein [Elainellaceae cyanobacterium]